MEEWFGYRWHRWLTGKSRAAYGAAAAEVRPRLDELNRVRVLLGGPGGRAQGAEIKLASALTLPVERSHWRALFLGELQFSLACIDQGALHLPERVDCYPDAELNAQLYLWWCALAAVFESTGNWLVDNQRATQRALNNWPGLVTSWRDIQLAELARRDAQSCSGRIAAEQERRIVAALRDPTVGDADWPVGTSLPAPVYCWLYPWPGGGEGTSLDERDDELPVPALRTPADASPGKQHRAKRVSEEREQHGLLLFRLENLFTVQEWIKLDRPEEDDDQPDMDKAGADADTLSLSRSQSRRSARIRLDLDLPAPEVDDLPLSEGLLFPEWNYRTGSYQPDHCRVVPLLSREAEPGPAPAYLRPLIKRISEQFKHWRPRSTLLKRQLEGQEIDTNEWIQSRLDPVRRSQWPVFQQHRKMLRERCALLLADVSQSTEAYAGDRPIIDGVKDSLMIFAEAMHAAEEPFALYSFSSIRRRNVRFHMLKNFAEMWSDTCRGRVQALKPGYYTRMGAAIRQAAEVLAGQPQQQKLLLLVTDGKPNDIDHYEHDYGLHDTRQAINEARRLGINFFAVTLDPEAQNYAAFLFGDNHYQLVMNNRQLVELLPRIGKQWLSA